MMFEIFDVDKTPDVSYDAFNERIHEDDRDFMDDVERKAIEGSDTHYVVQSRIRRRDNEIRYIEATAHIYRDDKGKAIKLIGTAQDVTELKRQEAERRKLIADLMQQNKDLQQFSYIISHNLRAPVANIVGLGKMYRSGKADERNEQIVKNMQDSAEDIDAVIKDLSNILTLRSGIGAEKELVSIQDVFSTVVKTLHPQIEEVTAKITSDFASVPMIFTIKSYLHSILYNLISNALKYRSPERALEINVASGKRINYAWISVQDNGLGIDTDKNREKLFGLYRRFHPQIEGKGIGLYLVKVQAETLGGWVEIESEPGKGTKFTVYLSINSLTQNEA
jgi:signal transduction histidine kinase